MVVTASIGLAVVAYLSETDKQRREFTMMLAMEFFSGDLQQSKDQLYFTIRTIQEQVAPIRLGPEDLNLYLSKKSSGSTAERDLDSALLAVAGFFNSAERCVESELCDALLMKELISADATAILCVFSGYLEKMAAASNVMNLRTGLEYFSREPCM